MKIPQERENLITAFERFVSRVKTSEASFFTKHLFVTKTHRAIHALKMLEDDACAEALRNFVKFLGRELDSSHKESLRFDIAELLKKIYAGCTLGAATAEVATLRGTRIVRASAHEDSGHTDETSETEETAYNGWFCDGGYTDHTDTHTDVPARDEVRFEI